MGLAVWLVSSSAFSNSVPSNWGQVVVGDGPPVSTLTVHVYVEGAMGDYIMRGCIVERNLEEGSNGVGLKGHGVRLLMGTEEQG